MQQFLSAILQSSIPDLTFTFGVLIFVASKLFIHFHNQFTMDTKFNDNTRFAYRQSSRLGDDMLIPALENAGVGGIEMALEFISLFTDTDHANIIDDLTFLYKQEFKAGTSDFFIMQHSSAQDEHSTFVFVNDKFDRAFSFDPQGSGNQCEVVFRPSGAWTAKRIAEGAKVEQELLDRFRQLDLQDDENYNELERLLDIMDDIDPSPSNND